MSILTKIAEYKKEEVAASKRARPLSSFTKPELPQRDFLKALSSAQPGIIAEIKKASPSKGVLREDFDVASIAKIYEAHGATCLSVLTDQHFFQGHAANLTIAKNQTPLPVLRKDFIVDSYQIAESYVLGADCILLIATLLDDAQLHDYCQQASALNLAVLVEVHTLDELQRVITLPTPLIGVNNRNLQTFSTDIQISIALAKDMPADKLMITESGIHTPQDILTCKNAGITCFLIGESLMKAQNIGYQLDEFIMAFKSKNSRN